MAAQLRSALMVFFILTILTGVAYPLAVTGIAQLLFPHQANGSLIYKDGKPIGSTLIGQPFDDPEVFLGTPFRDCSVPLQCGRLFRFDSRAHQSRADRVSQNEGGCLESRGSRQ